MCFNVEGMGGVNKVENVILLWFSAIPLTPAGVQLNTNTSCSLGVMASLCFIQGQG